MRANDMQLARCAVKAVAYQLMQMIDSVIACTVANLCALSAVIAYLL
jgi:hypothetical protein